MDGHRRYEVGPEIDEAALARFADLLQEAYDNGAARGSQMDWNDVQKALDEAVAAFGPAGRAYMDDRESGTDEPAAIDFAEGTPVTNDLQAAAKLLAAYQYPDDVDWEDVDAAWESLDRNFTARAAP